MRRRRQVFFGVYETVTGYDFRQGSLNVDQWRILLRRVGPRPGRRDRATSRFAELRPRALRRCLPGSRRRNRPFLSGARQHQIRRGAGRNFRRRENLSFGHHEEVGKRSVKRASRWRCGGTMMKGWQTIPGKCPLRI